MKVLITGSRNWKDEALIYSTLSLLHQVGRVTVPLLPPDAAIPYDGRISMLISGSCPTGADRIAEDWAEAFGVEILPFPADWEKGGRGAGLARNVVMVRQGPDFCMAYGTRCTKSRCKRGTHAHCSHGTLHCASLAVDAHIPTAMHRDGW